MKWNCRFLYIAAIVAILSLSGPSLLAQTPARSAPSAAPAPAGGDTTPTPAAPDSAAPAAPLFPAFTGTAPKIPNELFSLSNNITAQQQQPLDAYAQFWYPRLSQGKDEEIAEARVNLLDPVQKPGISDFFKQGYAQAVVPQLVVAFKSERITVRVNTMIIAHGLADSRLLRSGLLSSGMSDENPAVRYWAARAIAAVGVKTNKQDEKKSLMNLLVGQMVQEGNEFTLQQIMLGLGELNLEEATVELLRGLNLRVSLHIRDASIPLSPERDAMIKLFQRIVTDKTQGGARAPSDAVIKQLGIVAFRYLVMSAGMLDMKRITDPARVPEYEVMTKNCDSILRFVRETLAPQAASPQSIEGEITTKAWPMVRLRCEDWRKILTTPPMNMPVNDLEVPLNVNTGGN